MKPCAFDYVRIDSAEEACELLATYGDDARILAGGQSLVAMLNMRLTQPRLLIDVSRTAMLNYVRVQDGKLAIGAAATQASVEWRPGLGSEVPLLKHAFPHIAHFQVRNRGTVCGSIAHADPSAELPLCLVALEGEVVLRSKRGRRVVKAEQFFQGMLLTARRPDELLEEVRYPLAAAGIGYAFEEFSTRHGDFAIVACAAVVSRDEIRLAVGGVADRPRVARWARVTNSELDAALNDFAWALEGQDDLHASAKYRRHLVRRLGTRVVQRASAAVVGER
jgi:2-furoyl-CoA dehydrogenase FAD binding subunit